MLYNTANKAKQAKEIAAGIIFFATNPNKMLPSSRKKITKYPE